MASIGKRKNQDAFHVAVVPVGKDKSDEVLKQAYRLVMDRIRHHGRTSAGE